MISAVLLLASIALVHGCGKPAIQPDSSINIVGGVPATPGSWPWQVQIRKVSYGGQWCGGTLIDNQWVLSAAHCFHPYRSRDLTDYEFVVGAHHVDDESEPYRVTVTASDIILHEGYRMLSSSNDVALIKLSSPVQLNNYVSLACLPTNRPSSGTSVWVTGWGNQEVLFQSPYLQQVNVPIASTSACSAAYPGQIDDTMICAGYPEGGKDSCQGDSGGPLVVEASFTNTWYVAGVVSWGIGCADEGYYGVYSDVSYFNDWIQSTMMNN